MDKLLLRCCVIPACYSIGLGSLRNTSSCNSTSSEPKQKARKIDCADTICQSKTEMFRAAMQNLPKHSAPLTIWPNASRTECPVDRDELGVHSWSLLHTLAAYFPDNPSAAEESYAHVLLVSLAQLYPCHICAKDFQSFVADHPPQTSSRKAFVLWTCKLHNSVNAKLGKSLHPCNINELDERWRIGSPACFEKQPHTDSRGDRLN